MVFLGVMLLIVGVILFFVQKGQKQKYQSIRLANAAGIGEINQLAASIAQEIGTGNWKDYVQVSGVIQCDSPLSSELKQEPCVYYTMSVERVYEETETERDEEGNVREETKRRTDTLSSTTRSTPFMLVDESGNQIEVNPENADIDTVEVLDEFRPESEGRGGMLQFGNFSLAVSFGQEFSNSNRRTLGYQYSESILPVGRRVLVLAGASDASGKPVLQKPLEGDRKFLISFKDAEQLATDAKSGSQNSFYGMVGCLAGGVVLILIGLIF